MNQDKRITYGLSCLFAGILLLCCFVPKNDFSNWGISLFVAVMAVATGVLVKKRSILALPHRQVAAVMLVAAFLLVAVYLLTGLSFGYYRSPFTARYWWKYILPYALTICAGEYIRRVLLAQEKKSLVAITYIGFVFLDAALFKGTAEFRNFSLFWDYCGMTVIPAVTANLLYHFLSKCYGCLPVIGYRVILAVYPYFLPVKPQMPEAMLAFAKVLIPLLLISFIQLLYGKRRNAAPKRNTPLQRILAAVMVLFMTAFIMLISCKFRYGLLVIATESMTGSINKGDAVIYERYDDQLLQEGQVIVFSDSNRLVVHRIVGLEKINGVLRIYTKGDANEAPDMGFITTGDVVGIETMTVKYLGYPTVWMRELF